LILAIALRARTGAFMAKQQLSEMVGISRESTNKQLVAWAANGWVRLEHGAIVVLQPDALREVAEREDDDD
jgi:CRP/FNR family transcriptional regulator, cyclic AMP receptor protein